MLPLRCDGFNRRDMVRVGGISAMGLGLASWFRLQRTHAVDASQAKAKSCILIWLDGGPSHIESFDPKPNAPAEVRGPFRNIKTNVPGIEISECLPQTAQRMNHLAIIRSMTSPLGEHNFGTHYLMTGYKPSQAIEYPTLGSAIAHLRDRRPSSEVLPHNIAIPAFNVGGSKLSGNGFLPAETRPFSLGSDPGKPDFEVQDLDFYEGLNLTRLDRRKQFVNALNQFSRSAEGSSHRVSDPDLERAYNLVTSDEAKQAFDLESESKDTRAKYGLKSVGQSCLLARRLVERGVPFVTVNNRGWDTHEDLVTRLRDGFTGAKVGVGLLPSLDRALSALIDDLQDRSMLDETLIVVMGEFGRTPKLNTRGGRDHWPRVFSVALAGGGIRGGQAYGTSDAVGESPRDNPVTPADLAATLYSLLGVAPNLTLHTQDGRPIRICPPESRIVQDIIA